MIGIRHPVSPSQATLVVDVGFVDVVVVVVVVVVDLALTVTRQAQGTSRARGSSTRQARGRQHMGTRHEAGSPQARNVNAR